MKRETDWRRFDVAARAQRIAELAPDARSSVLNKLFSEYGGSPGKSPTGKVVASLVSPGDDTRSVDATTATKAWNWREDASEWELKSLTSALGLPSAGTRPEIAAAALNAVLAGGFENGDDGSTMGGDEEGNDTDRPSRTNVIVDPCCGGGTILHAAWSRGYHSIGGDVNAPEPEKTALAGDVDPELVKQVLREMKLDYNEKIEERLIRANKIALERFGRQGMQGDLKAR